MAFSIPARVSCVGAPHHRHDEALVGADGDADVVVVLVDQVLSVDLGVDGRHLLEGCDHRAGEEAHEAELHPMALLEHVLVLRAQVHDRLHVDLVEGREHGGGVLRLLQATSDGLAQARHPHPLLVRLIAARSGGGLHLGDRRRGGGRRGLRRRLAALRRGERVALGQAAVLAGALHGGGVEPRLRHDALDGGRQRLRRAGRGGLRRRLGGFLRGGRLVGGGLLAGAGGLLDGRSRTAAGSRPADARDHLVGRHGVAVVGEDLRQHAVRRRGDLDRHLVGLDLDQHFVAFDGVADLLAPATDGASVTLSPWWARSLRRRSVTGALRIAGRGGRRTPPYANASVRKVSSSLACRLAMPAAVEALAGRPT